MFGPPDDVSMIQPMYKKAPPTSVVWWDTIDGRHMCITGSDIGELTFLDVKERREVSTLTVDQCVDHLLLASHPNHSTYLLVRHVSARGHVDTPTEHTGPTHTSIFYLPENIYMLICMNACMHTYVHTYIYTHVLYNSVVVPLLRDPFIKKKPPLL